MNKKLKKAVAFTALTTAGIYCANRIMNYTATAKNLLGTSKANFYDWKNGDIFYTVTGSGSPILLVHDLHPASSSIEWSKIIKKLEKNHTVYCLDLLGCGRSDKPAITYTNYLYVQLLNDFIRDIIKKPAILVATGTSASFAIMCDIMNSERFEKVIVINPEDLSELMLQPDQCEIAYKHLLEFPVFGTFIYNIKMSSKKIAAHLRNQFEGSIFIPTRIEGSYIESAHLNNGNGKYLYSSIAAHYTNINVGHALPKVTNLSIIGSRNRKNNTKIIDEYTKCNSTIETAFVSHSKYLPQLEVPEKFYEVLKVLIER